jgi:hypothetical protein
LILSNIIRPLTYNSNQVKITGKIFAYFSSAHALGAFCGSVSTKSKLKKSEGYFFKEAQAAPLHERGPAALSDKKYINKAFNLIAQHV